MGGTDCAQPMLYAKKKRLEVDVFIVYTDSETWAGIYIVHTYRHSTPYIVCIALCLHLIAGFYPLKFIYCIV